jgi:hypothetical protein
LNVIFLTFFRIQQITLGKKTKLLKVATPKRVIPVTAKEKKSKLCCQRAKVPF